MIASPAASDDSAGSNLPFVIAGLCAVAAAAIVLGVTGSLAVAGGFAAGAIVIIGAVIVARRATTTEAVEDQTVDWSVAHTLASMSRDALAVTDRAGRLVCANERFGDLFPGYPAPPGVVVGDWAAAQLGTAGRSAWRDGSASSGAFDAAGTKLTAHVTRVGASMLVWRFAGTDIVDLAKQAQSLVAGASGDRLAMAGVMIALLGPDGRVRAANRVLRVRAMGDESAMIEGRDLTRFLITDNLGIVRFEREGLSGNPLRVIEIPFLDGDNAPMLVALLDEELAIAHPAIGDTAVAHVRSL
ncbi:MAG: hybrid sensor histidine kinase/response regulator, partial [Alphaproteobacteria bacterium HGW-Alphaproteobacteria-16]